MGRPLFMLPVCIGSVIRVFFDCHLAGLAHSGGNSHLRKDVCLKSKPDAHNPQYDQYIVHSVPLQFFFEDRISPRVLTTISSKGISLPAASIPFFTIAGRPEQQGTSITIVVTLLIPAVVKMSVNLRM